MLLRILHETKLTYSEPVSETVFEVRMAPPSGEDQTNLGYRLKIMPGAPVTIYRDGFGNRVDLFNILTSYRELIIRATSIVRTHRGTAPESRLAEVEFNPDSPELHALETVEYLQPSPLVNRSEELDEFLAGLPQAPGRLIDAVHHVNEAVRSRLIYEKKVTTARTPVGEALRLGRGVCQDFAHLFIGACRGLGLPARYVSGYIHQTGEVATHAWCQVWTGDNGWIDFDPTRATLVGDDYVKIGIGRDYSDVPPNRGVWKGRADETIAVSVKIEPIERVPTDWSDWSAIQAPWSAASWIQSQSRGQRVKLSSQTTYRQQQGQQQQT
jgi:transglutaminase-like putative cysteine protease